MKQAFFKQQAFIAFFGGLSQFCGGAAFSWFAPLADTLQSKDSIIPLAQKDVSWMVALFEVGSMLTPIPTGYVADRWGRKPLLLAFGPAIALTWVFLIVLRQKLTFYVLRVVQGMLSAVPYTVLPIYLAEISEPRFRGRVTSFFNIFMWQLGVLYVHILGTILPYKIFTYAMLAPPALFTITFMWCPETPYFLIMSKRKESAAKALALLRDGRIKNDSIIGELKTIEESFRVEKHASKGCWTDLFRTRVGLRALLLSQFVVITCNMTGEPVIEHYITGSLAHVFSSESAVIAGSVAFRVGVVLVMIPAFFLVDSLGRRPILLTGLVGCTLSLLAASAVLHFSGVNYQPDIRLQMLYYATSILSVFFVVFGIQPVVPILQSELFNSNTRGTASGFTTLNAWLFAATNAQLCNVLQKNYGLHVVYFVCFCFSLLGTVIIYIFVPETKKKSFEEIQKII